MQVRTSKRSSGVGLSSVGRGLVGFALVALCASACVDEDDGDGSSPLGPSGNDGGTSAGGDPGAGAGTAGSGGEPTDNGGAGGSTSAGTDAGASDDPDDEPPAQSGETGIFVGATAAHNAIRDQLSMSEGLNPPLPDLTWSDALAVVAQDWADTLTSQDCGSIAHRPNGRYGENIAQRGSRGISLGPMPPDDAVEGWANEIACWTYGRITGGRTNIQSPEVCDQQCATDLFSTGCGHYTQLVWANTRQVGCGYSTCTDDDDFLVEVWVCNYDPPGNVVGQFPYVAPQ
jgi:pathogenesis-related protein 1